MEALLDNPILQASSKKRTGASVNAYLILRQEDQVLLHLRKNTGYMDGYWGLISGHVEDGEGAIAAIVRETLEEADIVLDPAQLSVAHVLHRKSDRLNVDIFFECSNWKGMIRNKEPDKCAALEFFQVHDLPAHIIDYIATVLKTIPYGKCYSEWGWQK